MKNAPWILLSLAVLAAAYFVTGTSSAITTTNDIGTFCRAAGFVGPASVAQSNNEPIMAMPQIKRGPHAQINTIFKSPSSPPSKP